MCYNVDYKLQIFLLNTFPLFYFYRKNGNLCLNFLRCCQIVRPCNLYFGGYIDKEEGRAVDKEEGELARGVEDGSNNTFKTLQFLLV